MKPGPSDHAFTLRCYAVLGYIAQRQGRHDEAAQYFSYVLEYKPAMCASRSLTHQIKNLKRKAAASLLWIANNPELPPTARLSRIKRLIMRYPQIERLSSEILEPELAQLDREQSAAEPV